MAKYSASQIRIDNGVIYPDLKVLKPLKEKVENNPWHNNEDVYTHTKNVLTNLFSTLEWIGENNHVLYNRLQQKVDEKGTLTYEDALKIAALYHDVGKQWVDQVIGEAPSVKDSQGTYFPGHEAKSAEYFEKEGYKLWGFTDKEKEFITYLIKYHGELHGIVSYKLNKEGRMNEKLKEWHNKHKDRSIFLMILVYADTVNGDLKENAPKEYEFRVKYYEKEFKKYL